MTDTPHGGEQPPGPQWSAPGSEPGSVPPPHQPPLQAPLSASAHAVSYPGPAPAAYQPPRPVAAPAQHWAAALTAHKPGIIPLRPLGFGDLIEGAVAAMRRNPRTIFGLALLTTLVVAAVVAVVGAVGYLTATQLASGGASDTLFAIGTFGGITVLYLLSAVVTVALTGMLSYPVGEGVLGRKPRLGETWRRTRRALPRLAGLCLILLVPLALVFGGLVALAIWAFSSNSALGGTLGLLALLGSVVAAGWAGVRLTLATPALVLEDIGVVAALRRSWGLTAGRFWRTLGVLLVASLLAGVVQQVLSFGFQLLGLLLAFAFTAMTNGPGSDTAMLVFVIGSSVIGSLAATLIAQPFLAGITALLYTDARIRNEGFDLALVRAATSAPTASTAQVAG